ncbi:ArnT family glycosyltransferase [Roseomonas sp. BN140053]|uniref:ArnT family glycosyltransferase n=1 Tax=Roseomonas sp. BN140053 TaxID=3391898 RepID=UPI0039EC4E65
MGPQLLDRLPETRRPRLLLSLLCLLLWLPGFFTLPPGDRDESRFAQASRQMVESGDWVRIRNQEEERNKKPVGIHWAQAGVVTLLDAAGLPARDAIWAYRIPSALGAWIAVLATFGLGRALVGRRAAFLGAALLASTLLLGVEAHIAKTDAALLATVAVSMGLMGRAYLSPGTFSARQATGFWLALGVGILLKGPIGPLVPLLAGITLAVSDRRAPWLRALRPGWGLPLALAVAVPWLVAIGIATEGRFFAQAVGGDMLSKVGSGEESHWGPPGYYLLISGLTAFPAAFLVLRALPGAWAARLQPATRFLLAWAAPTWLVFEAVSTKLPHYVLPAFPALMLLAGAWALDPLRRRPPRWLAGLGWLALGGVALGLAAVAAVLPWIADRRVDPVALLAIPAAGLLVWQVVLHGRDGQWARAGLAAAVLAVPLQWVLLGGVLPRLHAPWIAPRLAAAADALGMPAQQVGLMGFHEPSGVFAIGTRVRLLRDVPDAMAFLAEGQARGEARLVAVPAPVRAALAAAAAQRALPLREDGQVGGFNYTRGRAVTLLLFRFEPGEAPAPR